MCQAIPIEIGSNKVLLIDTPGFDDTERSDSDILTEIARLLAAQYELGIKLKGVIYLHRITDVRYQRSSVKTLQIFKEICGKDALRNVLLVTTRWGEVEGSVGADRERQLRDKFWAYMLANGSMISRYYGDRHSAVGIATQLLGKSTVVLDLQRELVENGKNLSETAAGALVDQDLENRKKEYREEIAALERARQDMLEGNSAMRKQFERDWAREQARLEQAQKQQANLQTNVASEVRTEIRNESQRKKTGLSKLLPFIPTVLSLLGMFVGIPPGSFELLTGWFTDFGNDDSVTEFFSSF